MDPVFSASGLDGILNEIMRLKGQLAEIQIKLNAQKSRTPFYVEPLVWTERRIPAPELNVFAQAISIAIMGSLQDEAGQKLRQTETPDIHNLRVFPLLTLEQNSTLRIDFQAGENDAKRTLFSMSLPSPPDVDSLRLPETQSNTQNVPAFDTHKPPSSPVDPVLAKVDHLNGTYCPLEPVSLQLSAHMELDVRVLSLAEPGVALLLPHRGQKALTALTLGDSIADPGGLVVLSAPRGHAWKFQGSDLPCKLSMEQLEEELQTASASFTPLRVLQEDEWGCWPLGSTRQRHMQTLRQGYFDLKTCQRAH